MTTENKIKELLNKLIKLGWKPRGYETNEINIEDATQYEWKIYIKFWTEDKNNYRRAIYTLRDLVSLESGLWQFICEKWLYNKDNKDFINRMYLDEAEMKYIGNDRHLYNYNYEFWIMLSSIEEDIEQFLIDNMTTEWAKPSH